MDSNVRFHPSAEALAHAVAQSRLPADEREYRVGDWLPIPADMVLIRGVEWVWPGFIPRAMLTVCAGEPESAKSTLATLIASIITTGREWPDGALPESPGAVVWWSGEEDMRRTIVPRFKAHDAHLRRVTILPEQFNLTSQDDLARLASFVKEQGVRLVVVDPAIGITSGARDPYSANSVRDALRPWRELAEQGNVAVLCITHFAKGTSDRMVLERVLGSGAWGAVARVVLACTRTGDRAADGSDRAMIRVKSNIGPSGGGFRFKVSGSSVANPAADEAGQPARIAVPVARFSEYVEGRGDELFRSLSATEDEETRTQMDEAMEVWRELAASGRTSIGASEGESAGRALGISKATMHRARKQLGWQSKRIGSAWVVVPETLNS